MIKMLNLEGVSFDESGPERPLFSNEGLALDSIDALGPLIPEGAQVLDVRCGDGMLAETWGLHSRGYLLRSLPNWLFERELHFVTCLEPCPSSSNGDG
ncbi:hypothetical protein [Aestuariirhabdus litorea]|nr:hypothetical protein [Aestuariirhabdus litorea]RWW98460.1 hypothetical protein DZC74_09270 [Endozoicomonadaceae bacterium GTF-13]